MSTPFHRSFSEIVRKECFETLSWIATAHPVEFRAYSGSIIDEALDSGKIQVVERLISLGAPTTDSHLTKAFKMGNLEFFRVIMKAHPQSQSQEGASISSFLDGLQNTKKEEEKKAEEAPKDHVEYTSSLIVKRLVDCALPFFVENFLSPNPKVAEDPPPLSSKTVAELSSFFALASAHLAASQTSEKKD